MALVAGVAVASVSLGAALAAAQGATAETPLERVQREGEAHHRRQFAEQFEPQGAAYDPPQSGLFLRVFTAWDVLLEFQDRADGRLDMRLIPAARFGLPPYETALDGAYGPVLLQIVDAAYAAENARKARSEEILERLYDVAPCSTAGAVRVEPVNSQPPSDARHPECLARGVTVIQGCADDTVTSVVAVVRGRLVEPPEYRCGHPWDDAIYAELARVAQANIPGCGQVAVGARYGVSDLLRCLVLEGDRASAAEVANLLGSLAFSSRTGVNKVLARTGPETRYLISGRPPSATDLLRGEPARVARERAFFVRSIDGRSARRVEVRGYASQRDESSGRELRAPFSQRWENRAGEWRITLWDIGEFAPAE